MSALPELPRRLRDIDAAADRDLSKLASLASAKRQTVRDSEDGSVKLIDAASVRPEPIRWLWPGWLARGKLHVLAGAPGTGKTTIAMHFAACVSAGHALPSGFVPNPGRVLIWSGEDDPADTLVPRLIAAGADLARVHFVGDVSENGDPRPFDPARDVSKLAAKVAGVDNVALLIVDPLVSAVSGDSHKNAEVRRGLAPLVDLAARIDAALLGITHYSKGTQGREPLERVSGSLAFGALARVVLGTVKQQVEEGQPQTMMLARAKSNVGPDGGGYAYSFEQVCLPEHDRMLASRISWGAAVDGTARELLGEAETDTGIEGRDAATWLSDLLSSGPMASRDVQRAAREAGYAWRTVQRATRSASAEARREGFGRDAKYVWSLVRPSMRATCAPCTPHSETGAHGAHGPETTSGTEELDL